MKTLTLIACCSFVALFAGMSFPQDNDLAGWAKKAVSPDPSVAREAQDHLRAVGPQGLEALEKRFAKEISAYKADAVSQEWARIGVALDRVGGQYDNYASGLYWYTDLEQAKAAARASGRPILSLRLLGRLDEDLSCANSRFFRTTLYPSAEVKQLLKDRFILHWESVRPAPRVTIDFGDGRKLVRTITGNSIHYILDADGNIVDALPGLYSASVFVAELGRSADAVREAHETGSHDYRQHLQGTQSRLLRAWATDLAAIHVSAPVKHSLTENDLEPLMDDQKWHQLAQLPGNQAFFDAAVVEVMARKFPSAPVAARVAIAKSVAETPVMRELRNLSGSVALDTVRNNYMLRSKILAFLQDQTGHPWTLAETNNWVYETVFLTPGRDPWLGLAPPDVFSAIDKNGESQ
ncbi:MAG TPA: hypothetical protein VI636_25485 [Candidatus Angelobacter sp.]